MKLIDADALKLGIISQSNTGRESYSTDLICEFIDEQPEIDVRDINVGKWIPADNPPKTNDTDVSDYVLISFENFSVPTVGRYEIDQEGNGAYYIGDDDKSLISYDMIVNAWMPLPKPYRA